MDPGHCFAPGRFCSDALKFLCFKDAVKQGFTA